MTTKVVGTGGDYANMTLATAGIAAVGGGITDPWIFNVKNQLLVDSWTGFGASYGATVTNTITVQPGPGNGFGDVHDYNTAPLELDISGSGGACLDYTNDVTPACAPFNANACTFVTIQGLQFRGGTSKLTLNFDSSLATNKFQRNLCRGKPILVVTAVSCNALIANNLFVSEGFDGSFPVIKVAASGSNDTYFVHNTCVQVMNVAGDVFHDEYLGFSGGIYAHGFGIAAYTNGSGEAYHDAGGAGNNLTQVARNISNTATDVWATPNSSQSGNIANDFEDAQQTAVGQNSDFRPKVGGLLMGFIPAASYYNPAAFPNCAATDIRGQTRVTGSPLVDVGCFQRTGAGAPVNILINLNSAVVDNGLNDIVTNGTRVHVCSSLPTTYATALSTSLGNSAIVFGSPQTSVAADGRKVSSTAIVSTGSITATGTVSHWAVVDIAAGGRLLAAGPIDVPEAVTSGMVFSLGSLALVLPRQ